MVPNRAKRLNEYARPLPLLLLLLLLLLFSLYKYLIRVKTIANFFF